MRNPLAKRGDYSFLVGLGEELRRVMLTTRYFGDQLAIEALDRVYNIRSIILCRTMEEKISISNNWRQKKDAQGTEENGNTLDAWQDTTSVYCILLLDVFSQHYKFAVYNNKTLMTYAQLPADIRRSFLVQNKT